MVDGEGRILIPLEEFWEFVGRYAPKGVQTLFGVPRFTETDMEIDLAFSSDVHPEEWANPPAVAGQWLKLRESQSKQSKRVRCKECEACQHGDPCTDPWSNL